LSPALREKLYPYITEIAISFGVGQSDVKTIDSRGIAKATRLAMKKAVDQLTPSPDFLLVDYLFLPEIKLPQKGITHGDCLSFSIACASIIAKVTRDRLMVELDKIYPNINLRNTKVTARGHTSNACSVWGRLPSTVALSSLSEI